MEYKVSAVQNVFCLQYKKCVVKCILTFFQSMFIIYHTFENVRWAVEILEFEIIGFHFVILQVIQQAKSFFDTLNAQFVETKLKNTIIKFIAVRTMRFGKL